MILETDDAALTPGRTTEITVRILVTDRGAKILHENGDDAHDMCDEVAEAVREAFRHEGASAAAVREVRISVPLLSAQPKTEVVADGAEVAVSPDTRDRIDRAICQGIAETTLTIAEEAPGATAALAEVEAEEAFTRR